MENQEEQKINKATNSDDDLKELLKKNLAATEEVLTLVKKIKIYWNWQRAYFFLKLLILTIPLILGIIYLPPILEEMTDQYRGAREALLNVNEIKDKADNLNIDLVPEQLKGFLKK